MSRFIPELPPDSLEMVVVEVQTPSKMWLVDVTNKHMTKNYYDVEAILKQVIDRQGLLTCTTLFNVGDIVAVFDAVSSVWSRAKICDIYPKLSKFVYCLFLLDRGYFITSDAQNIRELPPEAKKLQFRCYHVQLYGIIPFPHHKRIVTPQNVELQAWPSAAVDEVRDLVDTCESIYFTLKIARKIVYGDIYLKFTHGYLNLANYLCDSNFAYYDDTKFKLTMEKSPYMSREESVNSETNTEPKLTLHTMSERRKPGKKSNFYIDDWDRENPSPYQFDSEPSPVNRLAEGSEHSAEACGERVIQRRTLALTRFCEQMRNSDSPHSVIQNEPNRVSDSQSPQKNLCYIGRGGRLELLKALSSSRNPGGISSHVDNSKDNTESKALAQESFCERFDSESARPKGVYDSQSPQKNLSYLGRGGRLEILKALSSSRKPGGINSHIENSKDDTLTSIKELSLYESKTLPQESCSERFDSECASPVCNKKQTNLDSNNVYTDKSVSSHYNRQRPQEESLLEPRTNVFCKNYKTVYIPAGSEMSMLVSLPKKNKNKRKPKIVNK